MSHADDNRELNQLLRKSSKNWASSKKKIQDDSPVALENQEPDMNGLVQWTTNDGKRFVPASYTSEKITPGVYDIQMSQTIGIFFQKIPIVTQGLLRFPETNSDRVVNEIQKFWELEETFKEYRIAYKRGIILYGPPGCHAAGTKIRMYDNSKKNVEDVCVGDFLMGPDSKPRQVFELLRGIDEMFKITPTKGESFVVNGNHILSMVRTKTSDTRYPSVVNMTVNDYLSLTQCSKNSFKLYHSNQINFETSPELSVDPYFLGIWLGDGTIGKAEVTSADKEIEEFLCSYAKSLDLIMKFSEGNTNSDCFIYSIAGNGKKNGNCLLNNMRKIGVLNNKFIPDEYMRSSRDNRLKLLAGIIDTDGTAKWRKNQKFKNKGYKGYFSVTQVRFDLANQILELARSLGFAATINKTQKGIKKLKFTGEYWRVNIFGNISEIPVIIKRKQALVGQPNKNPLRTGIKNIEALGKGNFYGFTISGDHLYLTEDYMVHHNSGKTSLIQLVMQDVIDRKGVVIKFTYPQLFNEGMRKFREIEPYTPVVILMEDIDSILQNFNESEVLNILDGVNQIENAVFLATTNFPELLGPRIINRPSRFDKRIKIDHPNDESRRMYLTHIIGEEKIKQLKIDLDRWVKDTKNFSIAHLKELFTAVVILGDDYEAAIDTLTSMKEEQVSSSDDQERKPWGFGIAKGEDSDDDWPSR